MLSTLLRSRTALFTGSLLMLALTLPMFGQSEPHYRKRKPLAPAARITLTVQKAENGKPLESAAVIFRASRDGKDQGSLEVKTNPDGQAKIDIIEIGSHVTVQVIADGYSTGAMEFDVPNEETNVLLKMVKPRAQVSTYIDNDGKAAQLPPGVQEPPPIRTPPKKPAPAAAAPAPAPTASSPQ